jgi:hypothetical protein
MDPAERMSSTPHHWAETDPVSEMLCSSGYQMMDKFYDPNYIYSHIIYLRLKPITVQVA